MTKVKILLVVLFGVLVTAQFAFTKEGEPDIRPIILEQGKQFSLQVEALQQAAQAFDAGRLTLTALQQQLLKTRINYKGIEYIAEYYYPEHTKEYLNGPPLLHLDPYPYKRDGHYNVSAEEYINSMPLDYLEKDHYLDSSKVIAPRGLQVLDELLFSEEATKEKKQVLALANELKVKWTIVQQALEKRKYFQPFEILEATRLQLIRLFTLGVTGFDTPGSLNALDEAKATLRALQRVNRPLVQAAGPQYKRLDTLYSHAHYNLHQAKDFNSFDRLNFLTKHLNPLYKTLLQLHQQLNFTTTEAIIGKPASWNYYSTNLFDADLLNPYYYSLLKKEQDNEALTRLGKKLFYDQRLSKTGTLSCGSCHKAERAFTDGVAKSPSGEGDHTVQRNAPSLINAVYADRYFYDLRSFDLEDQAGQVIKNHLEFNTDFPELLNKVNTDTGYTLGFQRLYKKGNTVSRPQFSAALTSFIISLRSFNSPFDQYVRGERKTLAPKVKDGFNLFMGKASCGTCHYAPLFSGLVPPLYRESESEVLGVLEKPLQRRADADKGRAGNKVFHEDAPIYNRAFKTVSVRNVALTAPYFHNGAYKTLEQVIDFYDHGGAAGLGIGGEVPNQTLAADSLHLSKYEKEALIAFLRSLTDSVAIKKFAKR